MTQHHSSLRKQIREMDADELQAKAEELIHARQFRILTCEEQEALSSIPAHYKALSGEDLLLNIEPQLAS